MILTLTAVAALLSDDKPAPAPAPAPMSTPNSDTYAPPSYLRPPAVAYPAGALSQAVEGAALIRCQVLDDGRLDACAVVQESPEGYGFGSAAIAAMTEARVSRSLAGETVQQRLNFWLAD